MHLNAREFLWTWDVFGCRGTKLEGVSAST